MKTRITCFLAVLYTVLITASCTTTTTYHGQYDKSVPREEQATLIIPTTLTSVRLNGSSLGGLGFREGGNGLGNYNIIKIPSGLHTITANFYQVNNSTSGGWETTTTLTASGLEITHDFYPGQSYKIWVSVWSDTVSLSIEESSSAAEPMDLYIGGGKVIGRYPQEGEPNGNFGAVIIDYQGGIFFPSGNTIWGLYFIDVGFAFGDGLNIRAGASSDVFFGQGAYLPGVGLGGGIYILPKEDPKIVPYIRTSFLVRSPFFRTRLFTDFYIRNNDNFWDYFGLGVLLAL